MNAKKKAFTSVGVKWGEYTREEIQEFLDWCVERGATAFESAAEPHKTEVSYERHYHDVPFWFFGIALDGCTFLQDVSACYATIVNTIEEAKEVISKEIGLEESQEDVVSSETPIKSDGGSSAYYRFHITSSITVETMEVETGDVIRYMVGNDFDLGNIIKACRRISQAMQGRGKEGIDVEYDANKIIYFAEQLKKLGK